jgi:hypothetical protein
MMEKKIHCLALHLNASISQMFSMIPEGVEDADVHGKIQIDWLILQNRIGNKGYVKIFFLTKRTTSKAFTILCVQNKNFENGNFVFM